MATQVHNTSTATHFSRMIENAGRNNPAAFAIGMVGSVPVLAVRKTGSAATAMGDLKAMSLPSEKATKPKDVLGGKLFVEKPTAGPMAGKTVLVLQCKRTPPRFEERAKKYLRSFKAAVPWDEMLSEEDLSNADEGDAVNAADEPLPVYSATPPANEPPPVYSATPPADELPPVYSATPPANEPPRPNEPAAGAEASVQRLTQQALKMTQMLKLEQKPSDSSIHETVVALLQKMSPDRVLLALLHSEKLADVPDAADAAPKPPIAHDDNGVAEVADGLAAMGANVARTRGVIGPNEAVNHNTIEKMVRDEWNKKADLTPDQLLEGMIAMFGPTFMTVDPKRLRGYLGLSGKGPAPAQQTANGGENRNDLDGTQDTTEMPLGKLAQARQQWAKDRLDAISGIGTLCDAFMREFAGDDEQAAALTAAIARLRALAAQLDDGLDRTLDEVLNVPDAERRRALRPVAVAKLDKVEAFVSEDELMVELDGNEILPEMQIVAPLKSRLSELRAALSGSVALSSA